MLLLSFAFQAHASTVLDLRGKVKTYTNQGSSCNFDFKYIDGWSGQIQDSLGNLSWGGWVSFEPSLAVGTILPGNGLDISSAQKTILPVAVPGCSVTKSDGQITGASTDKIYIWLEGKNCKPLTDLFSFDKMTKMTFEWVQVSTVDGSEIVNYVGLSLDSPKKMCQ